jgi:hypothetical protein
LVGIRLSDSKYLQLPSQSQHPHRNMDKYVLQSIPQHSIFGTTKDSFLPRGYAQHATSNSVVSTLRECVSSVGKRTESVISYKAGESGWLLLFADLCVGKEREWAGLFKRNREENLLSGGSWQNMWTVVHGHPVSYLLPWSSIHSVRPALSICLSFISSILSKRQTPCQPTSYMANFQGLTHGFVAPHGNVEGTNI